MSNRLNELALAKELGIPSRHVCIVGSTLICGSGNDVDFLCLVPDESKLVSCGFAPDIEVQYESNLRSYRRDGQNVIATIEPNFFFAEVAIAHAARLIASDNFDMSNRDERIRFHSEVRNNVISRMDVDPFEGDL